MRFLKPTIAVAILVIVIAIPVRSALNDAHSRLETEQNNSSRLRLKVDSLEQESKQKGVEINDYHLKQEKLRQENEKLKSDLQAKREEQARIAKAKEEQRERMQTAVSVNGNCEAYRPLVAQHPWDVKIAMAIMEAESGCREVTPDNSAINYDGIADHGLFQLHGIPVTEPASNISIAYNQKYLTQGWRAWSVFKNGAYLKFLR